MQTCKFRKMNKIKLLKTLFSHPKEIIALGIAALARRQGEVDYQRRNLEKYNLSQLPTVDMLDLIPGYSGSIHSFTYLNGSSMPTIILMLKCLAERIDHCSYLELGSFRGESIANVADVANDCTSITLSGKEMTEMGFDAGFLKLDRIFSKDNPKITYHLHNSLTFDFSTLNKKFDLISIDADNSYDSIVKDTRNVFKLLKNDQSIIVWHNYSIDIENGGVRQDVLAGILDGTPPEYRDNLYHVSNTVCAIFVRGKYPSTILKFPSYPKKTFNVKIEAVPFPPKS